MFKRLTAQQQSAFDAVRALGQMVVTPDDARPLAALHARGLIRYARIDGVRHAVLRLNDGQRATVRRRYASVIPRSMYAVMWAQANRKALSPEEFQKFLQRQKELAK